LKRNPYDEAECGHHYGRAMISWAEILALTGFHYSAVSQKMSFTAKDGNYLWSNGYAYGMVSVKKVGSKKSVTLTAIKGEAPFRTFTLNGYGKKVFDAPVRVEPGKKFTFEVSANDSKAGLPAYSLLVEAGKR
jgi:hypothetical protein